jgi:transcriptional regulator GlxA family with amidase domain
LAKERVINMAKPTRTVAEPTPARAPCAKLRVGFVLAHKFTLTALSNFVDVLRLAADEGDRSRPIACTWHVMDAGNGPIRSSSGLTVDPTSDLLDPDELDYVVVVGGLLTAAPSISAATAAYLRRVAAAKVTLVGLCTGSFILCRLGLMKDRAVCVSWYHHQDFTDAFPGLQPVSDRLYVIDRDRITCSGGTGVADVAARLVEKHLGRAAAQKALHILLIDRARPDSSAQPAPPLLAPVGDERVARALLWMEQHLAAPIKISRVAAELGMSERSLERLFRNRLNETPRRSYLRIRLRHAKWMLENTGMSRASIAAELGFVDSSHMSRCFKSCYQALPSAFRAPAGAGRQRASRRAVRRGQAARTLAEGSRRVFD